MCGHTFWYTMYCIPPLQSCGTTECLHSFLSTFECQIIPVVWWLQTYSTLIMVCSSLFLIAQYYNLPRPQALEDLIVIDTGGFMYVWFVRRPIQKIREKSLVSTVSHVLNFPTFQESPIIPLLHVYSIHLFIYCWQVCMTWILLFCMPPCDFEAVTAVKLVDKNLWNIHSRQIWLHIICRSCYEVMTYTCGVNIVLCW